MNPGRVTDVRRSKKPRVGWEGCLILEVGIDVPHGPLVQGWAPIENLIDVLLAILLLHLVNCFDSLDHVLCPPSLAGPGETHCIVFSDVADIVQQARSGSKQVRMVDGVYGDLWIRVRRFGDLFARRQARSVGRGRCSWTHITLANDPRRSCLAFPVGRSAIMSGTVQRRGDAVVLWMQNVGDTGRSFSRQ